MNNQCLERRMPKYVCHKEVHALQISGADYLHAVLKFTDEQYAEREMGVDWFAKHSPSEGGYLVVYKDGYTSFSPQGAFESGYTLVPEQQS